MNAGLIMMLRENLKQELDKLNEEQLKKIADFIALIEVSNKQIESSTPLWQKLTPQERAREFRDWVSLLPQTSPSLPDESFSREPPGRRSLRIYEE